MKIVVRNDFEANPPPKMYAVIDSSDLEREQIRFTGLHPTPEEAKHIADNSSGDVYVAEINFLYKYVSR